MEGAYEGDGLVEVGQALATIQCAVALDGAMHHRGQFQLQHCPAWLKQDLEVLHLHARHPLSSSAWADMTALALVVLLQ